MSHTVNMEQLQLIQNTVILTHLNLNKDIFYFNHRMTVSPIHHHTILLPSYHNNLIIITPYTHLSYGSHRDQRFRAKII